MEYYEEFFYEIKKSDYKHPIQAVIYTTKKWNKLIFSNVLFIDTRKEKESIEMIKTKAKRMDFVFFNQDPHGKKWIEKNRAFYLGQIFGKTENMF